MGANNNHKILSYTALKQFALDKNLTINQQKTASGYHLWVKYGRVIYVTDIISDIINETDFEENYKDNIPVTPVPDTGFVSNAKLRYEQITENQTIANGSYTIVYTYTGSGVIYGAYLQFNNKEMEIKITIDSEDIMVDFAVENLPKEEGITPFIWRPDDKEVSIKFPNPIQYLTEVKISLKSSKNNKKLDSGYIVLSKVT